MAEKRGGIQSVGTGLRVLRVLAAMDAPAGLGVVAKACGLSAPQTHRYLVSLIEAGMARQDPGDGRYDLGPGALDRLARTEAPDPHLGHALEFVKPADGGSIMPTIFAHARLLPARFRT